MSAKTCTRKNFENMLIMSLKVMSSHNVKTMGAKSVILPLNNTCFQFGYDLKILFYLLNLPDRYAFPETLFCRKLLPKNCT